MLAPIQVLHWQCFGNIEKRFVMKWTNMCFRKLFCGFMQCYINSRLVFLSVLSVQHITTMVWIVVSIGIKRQEWNSGGWWQVLKMDLFSYLLYE